MEQGTRKSVADYTVGWISALPIERAAAIVMLEEQHVEPVNFQRNSSDENCYEWGSISGHCIVVASLPAGSYGSISAVSTAKSMLASLPNVKLGLLVGIGAGIPNVQHDVRLGDVVVSHPEGQHGGIIQYDLGKSKANREWELKGSLASPPKAVLHTLAMLQAKHEFSEPLFVGFLNAAMKNNPRWRSRYARPDQSEDRLFKSDAPHRGDDCVICYDQVERKLRQSTDPELHYGTIASGNMLVKDAKMRDEIVQRAGHSCICLDMESAGLIDSLPCLVIRGICDYADAHKNDTWQRYASATAAAFAKELLFYLPAARVNQIEYMTNSANTTSRRDKDIAMKEKRVEKLIQSLYKCPYTERKDRNYEAAQGTCHWFLNHPFYMSWQDRASSSTGLLWVSADAGCGKSVLARHLVDNVLASSGETLIYWFFKDDFTDQKTVASALCALIHQLFVKHRDLISDKDIQAYTDRGSQWDDPSYLWDIFQRIVSTPQIGKITCVIDALDECNNGDRQRLIRWITSLFSNSSHVHQMRMILTSRHYGDISDAFYGFESKFPNIHLDGDNEAESTQIAEEIGLVIEQRVKDLSKTRKWSSNVQEFLLQKLLSTNNRTYLWVHLTMEYIASTFYTTKAQLQQAITALPSSIDEAYSKILNESIDQEQSRLVLSLIVAAMRPLSLYEMSRLLALSLNKDNLPQVQEAESERNFKTSIRNLCGLFIIIKDSQIFLLHQTARDFLVRQAGMELTIPISSDRGNPLESKLVWKHCLSVPQSNRVIADRCIWFLLTYVTEPSPRRYAKHQLLWEYCASHWVSHFTRAELDGASTTTEHALLLCNIRTNRFWNWLTYNNNSYRYPSDQACKVCPLLTPAAMGLTPVIERLLEQGIETELGKSQALWWATFNAHRSVALLLLKHDTNPNIDTQYIDHDFRGLFTNYTPLHNAIIADDEELVNALCNCGALVGEFAFQLAISPNHNEAIIQCLINRVAEVGGVTKKAESALILFQRHSKGPDSTYEHLLKMFNLLWNGTISTSRHLDGSSKRLVDHSITAGCVECMNILLEQQTSADTGNWEIPTD